MALQYRRNVEEDSSDESDEDYVLPEQVEMEGKVLCWPYILTIILTFLASLI